MIYRSVDDSKNFHWNSETIRELTQKKNEEAKSSERFWLLIRLKLQFNLSTNKQKNNGVSSPGSASLSPVQIERRIFVRDARGLSRMAQHALSPALDQRRQLHGPIGHWHRIVQGKNFDWLLHCVCLPLKFSSARGCFWKHSEQLASDSLFLSASWCENFKQTKWLCGSNFKKRFRLKKSFLFSPFCFWGQKLSEHRRPTSPKINWKWFREARQEILSNLKY